MKEFIEFIAKHLVDKPEEVEVTEVEAVSALRYMSFVWVTVIWVKLSEKEVRPLKQSELY